MRLPPRWARRVLVGPAVVLGAVLLLTSLPLWLVIGTAATAFIPGILRIPRLLWLATFYLLWDSAALVCLFGLWVGSGFGRNIHTATFQHAHYRLAAALLDVLSRHMCWVLRLRVEIEGASVRSAMPGVPIIVASRHGGPGDSFLLLDALFNRYDREPRVVLKDTLQWDPAIDVVLNRLPNRFIAPSPSQRAGRLRSRKPQPRLTDRVGGLAKGLDVNDAFVIFPEGGQFSARRRLRHIERLQKDGHHAMAERAAAMRHVMAPRPGGMLAALDAAPDAGVIFIAHTGLDRLLTVTDIWRELPMDKRIVMHGWGVRPQEIPVGRDARIDWLYDWWERIDRWIEENRGPDPAAVSKR
ncbi:MAG: 1-acyl-sn-glycerol-3-phosphate acyltransferase [Georgenia sp.]